MDSPQKNKGLYDSANGGEGGGASAFVNEKENQEKVEPNKQDGI